MPVTRVEQITYGVENVTDGIKYFKDWGLSVADESSSGADFLLPSGQVVAIRGTADTSLPAAIEVGSTLRETTWGVDSPRALDEIASRLETDRKVKRDGDGTLHAIDHVGLPIAFRVQKGEDPGLPGSRKINEVTEPGRSPRPVRIGHVVFFCPNAALERETDFYTTRCEFRISDQVRNLGAFLRAPKSTWHHNLFLQGATPRLGLHHVAFDVNHINEVVTGGHNMLAKGYKPYSSLGRHIMGSNIFWYFRSVCGGQTEYSFDMDRMDDNWRMRVWDKTPGLDQWQLTPDDIVV